MSEGFSSGNTRSMESLEHEIEYRLGQMRLDVFTKDFASDGMDEIKTGQDVAHSALPYGDKHSDSPAVAPKGFVRGAAAGPASDQPPLDKIDREAQQYEAEIKGPKGQFPMKALMSKLSRIEAMLEARSK